MNGKLLKEKLVKSILFICAAFSIILVLSIIGYLAYEGGPAVIGFFLHGTSIFNGLSVGPGNAVLVSMGTTVYLAGGATVLAVIIGLPCAIYMAEFADMRLRNLTKTSLEVLDGFPSIVIGLLGWDLLVTPSTRYTFTYFLHTSSKMQFEGCVLFGWLILLVMSFPIIATISEDALRSVSQDLREASLGLGATKWQTTREVLLPSAMPRVVTAILLSLAAAMGEMVALNWVLNGTITPALVQSPSLLILNPLIQSKTMSILMENGYTSAMDSTGSPAAGIYAIGFILFVMIGAVNIAARMSLANRGKTMRE
jgi:ABC-type phosphate transport system permease subunit